MQRANGHTGFALGVALIGDRQGIGVQFYNRIDGHAGLVYLADTRQKALSQFP